MLVDFDCIDVISLAGGGANQGRKRVQQTAPAAARRSGQVRRPENEILNPGFRRGLKASKALALLSFQAGLLLISSLEQHAEEL